MPPQLLAKLYSAVDEVMGDESAGLTGYDKAKIIRDYFEAEGDDEMLDDFLSWFDEE